MFTLDELIVRPDDQIGDLIETRARLFLDKFKEHPTTAFIPPGVYRELMRELAYNNRHSYGNPSPAGFNHIIYQTSLGTIKFRVISEVRSFLLVGLEDTYADLEFTTGIPRELWSDSSRRKVDEDFEKEFFGDILHI